MKIKSYLRGLGVGLVITSLILHFTNTEKVPMSDEEVMKRARELGMIENTTLASISLDSLNYSLSEDSLLNELNSSNSDNTIVASDNRLVSDNMLLDERPDSTTSPETSTSQSIKPSESPSVKPSESPSAKPSESPSAKPSESPSAKPSESPSVKPSESPSAKPSESPSVKPSESPSVKPSESPSMEPSTSPEATNEGAGSNVINTDKTIMITVSRGDGSYTVAKKLQNEGIIESAAEFDEFLCNNGYDKKISAGTHVIEPGANWNDIASSLTSRSVD